MDRAAMLDHEFRVAAYVITWVIQLGYLGWLAPEMAIPEAELGTVAIARSASCRSLRTPDLRSS